MGEQFEFKLNQHVVIACSGEQGIVVGRAEYNYCDPNYLVRYKAADGRAVENWWVGSALLAAE